MSIIGLILCVIIVAWLLKEECRQNHSASWALWIPTLWFLKIATLDLAFYFGRGDAEKGTGSPFERYFLIILLFLGLVTLYRRRFDLYKAIKENIWLMVLICYMFLSVSWSDTPFISFKRWTRELIAVIMCLVIFSEADPRRSMQSALKRFAYIVIPLSLLVVVFFPEFGIKEYTASEMVKWRGITGGKNQLGRLCLIAAFFLIWALVKNWKRTDDPIIRKQKWIDFTILSTSLFLMKGPGFGKMLSITSIITLVLGLGTFFGLLLMQRFKRDIGVKTLKIVIAACIMIGTASVIVGGLVVGESITDAVGREATLTGRIEIWGKFLPLAMEESLIGHGVGGFWTDKMINTHKLNTGHNGYLDLLLDYGFVGLVFFSLFLLSSCGRAHKDLSIDYEWGSLWIGFLVMCVIYNVAEATIDSLTNPLSAILLFLYVSSAKTPENLHV